MPLGKDKLIYDSTTASDGDSVASFLHASGGAVTSTTVGSDEALDVAAYLRDASGNLLTSTLVGSDQALDVNMVNTIDVDIDGDYNVTTNPTPDSAGLIAHDRAASPAITDQNFRSTGGAASSDAVVAANVHGLDVNAFGMAFNGTTWDRMLKDGTSDGVLVHIAGNDVSFECTGNVADDAVDSGNPVKVGSRAVDAALTELSATGDRADLLSDIYRRVYVNDSPNIELAYGDEDVTTSAASLVTATSGRRRILLQNLGNKAIFIGDDASVTTTNGFRVAAGAYLEIPLGEHIPLFAISESGTQDVRWLQLA